MRTHHPVLTQDLGMGPLLAQSPCKGGVESAKWDIWFLRDPGTTRVVDTCLSHFGGSVAVD